MRPVNKGAAPDTYKNYQDAGPDLRRRLGGYCSYCERRIETNLAVEHVRPKSVEPTLITDWANLLLACTNCNSIKGNTAISLVDYFWPDTDNTLRAFKYLPGGLIDPHPSLSSAMAKKAVATLQLIGLDRYPGNAERKPPTSGDDRWGRRREIWAKAEMYRDVLTKQNSVDLRRAVVDLACGWGEFSIWWTVFADDVDMRRRLREAFKGTDGGSFDSNENLVPRAGGQL